MTTTVARYYKLVAIPEIKYTSLFEVARCKSTEYIQGTYSISDYKG